MAGTGYLRVAVAVAAILERWRQMKSSEDAMRDVKDLGQKHNNRRNKP
jgi:hypothetical protein